MSLETIKDFRDFVESVIGSYLGTYTMPGTGQTFPAITLLAEENTGFSAPPKGTKIEGLEAVIIRNQSKHSQMHGNTIQEKTVWQVLLKFWAFNPQAQEIINELILETAKEDLILGKVIDLPITEETGNIQQVLIPYHKYIVARA